MKWRWLRSTYPDPTAKRSHVVKASVGREVILIGDSIMASLDDIYKKEFFTFTESELFEYLDEGGYDDAACDRIIDGLEREGLIVPDEP